MNFLYPQLLFGLAALVIPVIIHLFNFRRTKKVYFSSNRFLRNIQKSSSSRLRLKHWLILASRLLFVFFLVLAFAQPFYSSQEVPGDLVKIYVDNSYSMSNPTEDDIAALDVAIESVQALVGQYPKHTQYQLLTNEFYTTSEQAMRYDKLLDALTEIRFSPISRSIDDVLSRLQVTRSPNETAADIYIFSDFQKSTSMSGVRPPVDSSQHFYLAPVNFRDVANLFVDSVYLSNPYLLANNANAIHVRLRNNGAEVAEETVVKLMINDIQVATAGATISPMSTTTLQFDINFDLSDVNSGKILFEDFPVVYDNEFYFALNTTQKIDILEIRGEKASGVLSKVYGNEQLFDFKSYSINNVDYNLIKDADIVFINEVNAFHATLIPHLQQYVEEGGHVVIVFGEHPSLERFSFMRLPEHFTLNNVENLPLQPIAQPDLSNPFLENIFEATDEAIAMPMAANTVTWSGAGMDILTYNNGVPFVSRSVGGNIYYIGGPLRDKFSNFHNHALFVPIMYRLAASSQSVSEDLYHYIDEPQFAIKRGGITTRDVAKLVRDSQEIIPSQMVLGNQVVFEVPKYTLEPGFYKLQNIENVQKTLAFNYSKAESYLDQMSVKELSDYFGGVATIYDNSSVETFKATIKERNEGRSLWKVCLMFALAFLLIEILLIRLMK